MAVEEHNNTGGLPTAAPPSAPGLASNPPRCQPNLQPPSPYHLYAPAEYGQFYNSAWHEAYSDYGYGMSTVEAQYCQQPGMFFDYGQNVRPPVSQFYYPFHQNLLYPQPPHSPVHTPSGAAVTDKKQEAPVSIHTLPSPRPAEPAET
jgi:hypothetical protein